MLRAIREYDLPKHFENEKTPRKITPMKLDASKKLCGQVLEKLMPDLGQYYNDNLEHKLKKTIKDTPANRESSNCNGLGEIELYYSETVEDVSQLAHEFTHSYVDDQSMYFTGEVCANLVNLLVDDELKQRGYKIGTHLHEYFTENLRLATNDTDFERQITATTQTPDTVINNIVSSIFSTTLYYDIKSGKQTLENVINEIKECIDNNKSQIDVLKDLNLTNINVICDNFYKMAEQTYVPKILGTPEREI